MKPISKRLFSLLLAVVLVLGLPSQAMAATNVGGSETTATQPTDATEPVSTDASDPTEPVEPEETTTPIEATEETTAPTEAPEETTIPTEPQEETEPEADVDVTDPAQTTEPTEPTDPPDPEGEEETGLIIRPDPIVAENPYDPEWPYPYGLPVDNDFPDDLLEVDPYGIALMADMSLIPDEMYDNYILRALEYTGYDVQKMKDNGWLYVAQYTSSNINSYAPEVLSDIGYDDYSPFLNGDETVADSSTVTGRAPNIASFESNGLVCASFVTYYMCNYLPNIEGIDTTWIHDAVKATTMNGGSYSTASVWSWETGLSNLASKAGSGVTRYTDADTAYANLVPGDLIVFSNSSGSLTHIAVYAGTYTMYNASGTNRGPYHYIIHVGNSRGPEISAVEYMVSSGSKSSSPSAWYHIDLPEVQSTGFIEVYKKDPNGKNLSGAYFTAVDQATGDKYVIGPTDSNGYAKSGEMPLGTFVVTETKFPTGYGPSGETSWTVMLTEDTPNMTITINAVNELVTGSAKIVKATTNGGSKAGWHFEVKNSSGTVIGNYVTDATGVIVLDLVPGTYTVTETDGAYKYWVNDPNPSRTVTVKADETATVTFTNQWRGQAQIVKTTTNGGTVAGWHFTVKNSSGTVIGNYVTDSTGIITLDLEPGTYTVTETDGAIQYWENDPNPTRTVTVKAGETAKVTFKNQYRGAAQIIKATTNGGTVAGWHFEVKKCAIFLILPEEDATKNFVASLMIQNLARELFSVANEHGGKLPNRAVFFCDELGTMPPFDILPLFSAGRSRRLTLVPIIQSLAQLEKNYGKEGSEIMCDNCQDTIFGGFAPNSQTANTLSGNLGSRTVLSGTVTKGKNDDSQSLQMMERPLMSPDELKSMPKGSFVVMKTGTHPMKTKLKLFFEWGIQFQKPLEMPDRGSRPVYYAGKQDLERSILSQFPMIHMPMGATMPSRVQQASKPMPESTSIKTSTE